MLTMVLGIQEFTAQDISQNKGHKVGILNPSFMSVEATTRC